MNHRRAFTFIELLVIGAIPTTVFFSGFARTKQDTVILQTSAAGFLRSGDHDAPRHLRGGHQVGASGSSGHEATTRPLAHTDMSAGGEQAQPWLAPYLGPRRNDVDASTLRGKVLCGYQGWFRTPGDPTGRGWVHWGRGAVAPDSISVEMWPDVREYPASALAKAGNYTLPDGRPAMLFSSAYPGVVQKHFDWMRTYGIDGVMVQRFLGGLDGGEGSAEEARVLGYVRDAAARTGRTFAVEYDMSGTPPERAIETMRKDWRLLVDTMRITDDPRYLRHNGKPVLEIFGFFSDRFSGEEANAIIDAFDTKDKYAVSLVGAGQWWWRRERDPEWSRAFRRFAAYSPWDVGNVRVENGVKHPPTDRWTKDKTEAERAGMLFFPTVYPGFSWDNLTRKPPGSTIIPRRKGDFFREGFHDAADLGITQSFVAMFDEVDEGTAIFKVTNEYPTQGHFVGLEGLPPDAYLRIAGDGARLIHQVAHARSTPSKAQPR